MQKFSVGKHTQGILFWVKALQESYFDLLEDNDEYLIKWIDHLTYMITQATNTSRWKLVASSGTG